MPLENGEYIKLTQDEIQRRLENRLEEEFDTTVQPGDLIKKQLAAEAKTLAENQEEALKRVHQAAYLADATGTELDKVVNIIGLSRDEANPSTGVARFWRETPPTATYTIPNGAAIQTSGTDAIEFETTQTNGLRYIDGFEDGTFTNWVGEVDSFSILNTTELSGDYALEIPATTGVSIESENTNYRVGTKFTADMKLSSGANKGFRFGIQDSSNYFEFEIDETAQDLHLRLVEDGSETTLSSNTSPTIPVDNSFYIEFDWSLYNSVSVTLFETNARDTELCSVTLDVQPEWETGQFGIVSFNNNATALVDEVTTRSVHVNIESNDVGIKTNLGPNTITTITTPMAGVEKVTNPKATGSPVVNDTTFSPLVMGEERETDEELRDRAFNSTSIGGSATANALDTAIRQVDGVEALTLNRNRDGVEVDGMPSHSFEAVVYGGSDEDVAKAIFNTASIDSHDVGGVNGVGTSYTIYSEETKDTEIIEFSRPHRFDVQITVDLVVDDTYIGETETREIIVDYIGGTDINGNFTTGLDVGEDIYEAVLKQRLVNPEETGIWEVDSLNLDKDGDGTDDTTETTSGADVLAIGDNEVAVTNARDGSITINTTIK